MNGKTGSISTKRLYGILLALPLLVGACNGEENTYELPQGNTPIGFSGDVPETRATKEYTATDNLENIGVFAYFTHGNFNESTATPNFMYNQLVAKQPDGKWTYSPVKFWPDNSTTDKISFFAYAPYVKEAESCNPSFQDKETTSGFPVLSYTVPTAENQQIDFLASTPVMNQNNGNVSFKLRHTLTKVNIYVKSNDNTDGKSVTSFSLTGIKSGILTYHVEVDISIFWREGSLYRKQNKFLCTEYYCGRKEIACHFFSASRWKREQVQHYLSVYYKRQQQCSYHSIH